MRTLVKLGSVWVDSGQILICDPCYIDSSWKPEDGSDEFGGGSYSECCRVTLRGPGGQVLGGAAVACRTGYGDGDYDVIAVVNESTGRVEEVRIIFVEE